METTRQTLLDEAKQLQEARKEAKRKEIEKQMDMIAGKNHHLVGTVTIPGVYSSRPKGVSGYEINDDALKTSTSLKQAYKGIGLNRKKVLVKPILNFVSRENMAKPKAGPFLVLKN